MLNLTAEGAHQAAHQLLIACDGDRHLAERMIFTASGSTERHARWTLQTALRNAKLVMNARHWVNEHAPTQ